MKKRGRLLIALALVIVMALSIVLMACDDSGYKVTFDVDGGTAVEEMTDVKVIVQEPATMKNGHTFLGWFTNAERSGDRITFPYTVTADTTLYAKWQKDKDEEQVDDIKKFASAADVFGKTADLLFGALSGAVESINSKTLGYDINAVVGINDTKHHLDLSTAINVENVAVGALVNYEAIKGETSLNKVTVQVHDDKVYLSSGEKSYVMPFLGLDGLLAAVVGKEGIDFTAISSAWEDLNSYIPIVGGVLFNNDFTYDKDTNSATITVTNTELAGKIDSILSLLGGFDLGEGKTIQQLIDETVWNMGLPYEINLKEIVSAFNFQLDITLDMTAEDALEKISVALTLDKSEIVLKQLASCPTYVDGVRQPLVYEVDAENNVVTKKIDIAETAVSLDLTINARTTAIDAPAEKDFTETNLINVNATGTVAFTSSTNEDVNDYMIDAMLKANIDITKLIKIVDGKIVANTEEFANAGYFRLNLLARPNQGKTNEKKLTFLEICYDPANSKDTNLYVYLQLFAGYDLSVTVNLSDLVDYINSNEGEAAPQAFMSEDSVGSLETTVNSLLNLVAKLTSGTKLLDKLDLGAFISGIEYSYNNGVKVDATPIGSLLKDLTSVLNLSSLVGKDRDTIVVKVDKFEWFGAEKDYNAYEASKAVLTLCKSVELDPITVNYGVNLDDFIGGKLAATNTLTTGATDTTKFNVVKTVGYDPYKSGVQQVEVYGFYTNGFIMGLIPKFVDIPLGMIKTTLSVTVREPLEVEKHEASVKINKAIDVAASNKVTALGAKLSYKYDGVVYDEKVDAADITFLNSKKEVIDSIDEIGNYYVRVKMYTLTIDEPFTVYSTTLPSSFKAGTFEFGVSIESEINKHSYSYINGDGETITTNFSVGTNVIATKKTDLTDTTNILNNNNAIEYSGSNYVYIKFTLAINDDVVVISKSTSTIKQQAGNSIVVEESKIIYDNASVSGTFSEIKIYGTKGTTAKRLYPALETTDNSASLVLTTSKGKIDTKWATVSSLKIFDGENDITSAIYDTTTGKLKKFADLAYNTDKKLRIELKFTAPDDNSEYAGIEYSFSASFKFQNLNTSLKFNDKMESVNTNLELNEMISKTSLDASGNLITSSLKYSDGKYVMDLKGTSYGDVVITVKDSDDNDVTSSVLVDGKFTEVVVDTKYTLIFEFTPSKEGIALGMEGDTLTQIITVKAPVVE